MQLTVTKKLAVLSLVATGLTLVVGLTGYWGIQTMFGATVTMLRGDAKIAEHSAAAATEILQIRRWEKNMFLRIEDPKQVEESGKKLAQRQERLSERIRALKQVANAPEDRERVKQLTVALEAYKDGMVGVVAKIKTGEIKSPQAADQAILPFREAARQLDSLAEKFAEDGNARMAQLETPLAERARVTLWAMLGCFLVVTGVGMLLSFLVARTISRPLRQAVEMLQDIAEGEGDLTKRLEVTSRDEVGDLARWFNTFIEKIHGTITQVHQAAQQMASASQLLAAGSEQLSSGAQEQASSLEETAASLEEITSTIKQNADNAKEANRMAVSARGGAEKGGVVVRAAVASMGDDHPGQQADRGDHHHHRRDRLSDQSPGLECGGRSGPRRGAGPRLCRRRQRGPGTGPAIGRRLQGDQDPHHQFGGQGRGGRQARDPVRTTLTEIVSGVKRVADLIAEITAASSEQSQGIEQVNKAVTQMDTVTQRNAAQTEELSGTAQTLAAQAKELQAQVAQFTLAHAGGVQGAAGPTRPSRHARSFP